MKELIADIMPSHELVLTWENSGERLGKKQQALNLEIHTLYSENDKKWLLFLGCSDTKIPLSPSLNFWRGLAQIFLEKLKRYPDIEEVRHKADIDFLPEELNRFMDAAPLMIGREYLDRTLLAGVWKKLNQFFSSEIKIFPGSVKDFFHEFSPHIHLAGRVYFHLVESKDDAFPFQFLATYATQSENSQKHRPLHYALEEYRDHQDQLLELLTTVHAAAQNSDLLKELLDTGELFHHLAWDTQDAYNFLQQFPDFEHCGIICRIPDWWKKRSSKPMVKVSLGTKEPSFVGMNALLDFQADILIGDTPITLEEAQELLAQTSGLARIKNRWVEVDKLRLQNLLNAYEKAVALKNDTGLTIKEALQLQFHPDRLSSSGDKTDLEISNGEWLESIVKRLNQPELVTSADPAKDFFAILRHYQQKGLNWLSFLDSLGFGACLADDMGLGKTIQILGFLSILRIKEPDKTSLLIVPASLISNWENEIEQFLPSLTYYIAHPGYIKKNCIKKGQDKKSEQTPDLAAFNLVITTYAIEISIQKIKTPAWENILKKCQGQIDSLHALLDGKLPKSMVDILIDKKDGIFPSPGEIKFDCSCPDSATMCKHIAATLYGVGTRLDQDPSLFFTLRGVDMKKLVSQAIRKEADQLIKKSKTKTSKRIIQNADLSSTFGIDFDKSPLPGTTKSMVPAQKVSPKKPIKKPIKKTGKQDLSPYETVVRIISRRKVTPMDSKEIKKRTGLEDILIRNIIARAKQKGAIKNKGRGLYIKQT